MTRDEIERRVAALLEDGSGVLVADSQEDVDALVGVLGEVAAQARREALEEAARVCDGKAAAWGAFGPVASHQAAGAERCAEVIRHLAKEDAR